MTSAPFHLNTVSSDECCILYLAFRRLYRKTVLDANVLRMNFQWSYCITNETLKCILREFYDLSTNFKSSLLFENESKLRVTCL